MQEYKNENKTNIKKINLQKLNLTAPDLKNPKESKATVISKWMSLWIEKALKENLIKPNMLMPSKAEFAYFLGVSVGTIQNAIRNLEDLGYVESKQRIGTLIRGKQPAESAIRKLTSKREMAIAAIKDFITSNKMKAGSILPSSRAMSSIIGYSNNTTRAAFDYLHTTGVISKSSNNTNDNIWQVASINFDSNGKKSKIEQKTLVDKVENDLKDYITNELTVGDKIPAHFELAKKLNVSIKTVHDALKPLVRDGILLTRRGRYGTTVIKMPYETNTSEGIEKSIFAPAKDTAFYFYEKTQNTIKRMIAENYDIGSKLPSIMTLSKELDLSPNTIRKAFHHLAKDGYIRFSRGRYGGTFVTDIPSTGEEAFKWIAVSPQYTRITVN